MLHDESRVLHALQLDGDLTARQTPAAPWIPPRPSPRRRCPLLQPPPHLAQGRRHQGVATALRASAGQGRPPWPSRLVWHERRHQAVPTSSKASAGQGRPPWLSRLVGHVRRHRAVLTATRASAAQGRSPWPSQPARAPVLPRPQPTAPTRADVVRPSELLRRTPSGVAQGGQPREGLAQMIRGRSREPLRPWLHHPHWLRLARRVPLLDQPTWCPLLHGGPCRPVTAAHWMALAVPYASSVSRAAPQQLQMGWPAAAGSWALAADAAAAQSHPRCETWTVGEKTRPTASAAAAAVACCWRRLVTVASAAAAVTPATAAAMRTMAAAVAARVVAPLARSASRRHPMPVAAAALPEVRQRPLPSGWPLPPASVAQQREVSRHGCRCCRQTSTLAVVTPVAASSHQRPAGTQCKARRRCPSPPGALPPVAALVVLARRGRHPPCHLEQLASWPSVAVRRKRSSMAVAVVTATSDERSAATSGGCWTVVHSLAHLGWWALAQESSRAPPTKAPRRRPTRPRRRRRCSALPRAQQTLAAAPVAVVVPAPLLARSPRPAR